MSFFRFGKKIKHRQFDYIPRYYDPDKEELEARINSYRSENENAEVMKARIKGGFRRKYRSENDYIRNSRQRSNRILIITLVALLLLTALFISEYLPKIVSIFEN